MNFCGPRYSGDVLGVTIACFSACALGDLDRDAAADDADLALEVAHARLARVAVDDLGERRRR